MIDLLRSIMLYVLIAIMTIIFIVPLIALGLIAYWWTTRCQAAKDDLHQDIANFLRAENKCL